ncbi:hypothetical protein B14911_04089 [Bacillus sp. NRRL B-14911]|nr:hypothetical protein B14911_04089 [Bacillus sp. NRRL B-14911]
MKIAFKKPAEFSSAGFYLVTGTSRILSKQPEDAFLLF